MLRYTFSLGGRVISWCTKKQIYVYLLMIKSKHVAYIIWLRKFLISLDVTTYASDVVIIDCNNTIVVAYLKDPKYHLKHIVTRLHFV